MYRVKSCYVVIYYTVSYYLASYATKSSLRDLYLLHAHTCFSSTLTPHGFLTDLSHPCFFSITHTVHVYYIWRLVWPLMPIVRIESARRPALIFLFHAFDDSMTATWRGAPRGNDLCGVCRGRACGGPRVRYKPDKSTRVNPVRFHRIYTPCTPWVNVTIACSVIFSAANRNNKSARFSS